MAILAKVSATRSAEISDFGSKTTFSTTVATSSAGLSSLNGKPIGTSCESLASWRIEVIGASHVLDQL